MVRRSNEHGCSSRGTKKTEEGEKNLVSWLVFYITAEGFIVDIKSYIVKVPRKNSEAEAVLSASVSLTNTSKDFLRFSKL